MLARPHLFTWENSWDLIAFLINPQWSFPSTYKCLRHLIKLELEVGKKQFPLAAKLFEFSNTLLSCSGTYGLGDIYLLECALLVDPAHVDKDKPAPFQIYWKKRELCTGVRHKYLWAHLAAATTKWDNSCCRTNTSFYREIPSLFFPCFQTSSFLLLLLFLKNLNTIFRPSLSPTSLSGMLQWSSTLASFLSCSCWLMP